MAVARSLIEVMDGSPNRRLEEGADFKSVRKENTIDTLSAIAASPVTVPIAFVDSVAQSAEGLKNLATKPIRSFIDLESDVFNDNTFGGVISKLSPSAGEFYQRNGEAYRTTADLTSMFIGVGAITNGVRNAPKAGALINAKTAVGKAVSLPTNIVGALPKKGLEALPQTKFGKVLLGDYSKVEKARENLRNFTKSAINEGAELADLRTVPAVQLAEKQLRTTTLKQSVREAIGVEALMFAAYNESDLFFPDGFKAQDYAFFTAAGIGLGAGAGLLQGGAFVRQMNNAAGEMLSAKRSSLGIEPSGDLTNQLVMGGTIQNLASAQMQTAESTAKSNLTQLDLMAKRRTSDVIKGLGKKVPFENSPSVKLNDAQVEVVNDLVKRRPQDAHGIITFNSFGAGQILDVSPDLTRSAITKKVKDLDKALTDGTTKNPERDKLLLESARAELETFENSIIHVVDVDGTIADYSNRMATIWDDGFSSPAVARNKSGAVITNPAIKGDFVSNFGEVKLKNSIGVMSNKRITSSYAMFPKALQESETVAKKVIASTNPNAVENFVQAIAKSAEKSKNYIAKDLQIELLQKYTRDANYEKIGEALGRTYKGGIENKIQDLQLESLALKFKEFKSFIKKSGNQEITPMDMSRRLNLKLHDSDAEDATALFDMFVGMTQSGTNFNKYKTFGDFKQELDLFAANMLEGAGSNVDVKIVGNNHKIDPKMRPLSMVQEASILDVHRNATMAEAAKVLHTVKVSKAERAAEVYAKKLAEVNGFTPTVTRVHDLLNNLEETANLRTEIKKAGGGQERLRAADEKTLQSRTAAVLNSVIPQQRGFLNAEVRGFREASNISDQVQKVSQRAITDLFVPHEIKFNKFSNRKNRVAQDSLLAYMNSRGIGWDIAKGTKSFGNTLLESNQRNRNLLRQYLSNEEVARITAGDNFSLPDIGQLQNGKYVPAKITEDAEEILTVLRDMYKTAQLDKNAIRHARGYDVWEPKDFDLPPAFTTDKEVVFLRKNNSGEIVEAVYDKSLAGAQAKANARVKQSKGTLSSVTRQDAEQLLGDTMHRFMEKESISKSGVNATTGNGAVEGMKRWIVDSMNNTSKSVVHNYFEPEFNYMKMMQELNVAKSEKVASKSRITPYEALKDTLLNNKSRATGNFVIKTQDEIDKLLNAGFSHTMDYMKQNVDSLLNKHGNLDGKRLKEYEEKLGYNPLTLGLDAAGVEVSRTFDDFSRRVAAYTGFMTLQLANMAHMAVTLSTLPTVVPAVVREFAIRDGESIMDWRRRSGSVVDMFSDPTAPSISTAKMMIESTHFAMTKEGRGIIEEGNKLGNLYAPSVELSEHVFSGGAGFFSSEKWKRVSNLMTTPTRWSEEFYRQNSYAMGYKLAKQMEPTLSNANAHSFANNFANKAAGDYRTVEKPEQFQGAIGNQLGLFQTFFTNYWQRVIGNIEKGDKLALGVQAATQASIFGVETVPGYSTFSSMFSNYDGSVSPSDQFASAYGIELGEALLTGGVWSLPRLWGSEGIALYSPGDTNVRNVPSVLTIDRVPAVNMIRKMWYAIDEVTTANRAVDGFMSGRRAMEILPNTTIHRPLKGLVEVVNGYTTDKSGNVLDADTRESWMEMITRIAGAKPLVENRVEKALYRQRVSERKNRKYANAMNRDFVAQLRKNDGVLTDDMLVSFITQYEKRLDNPTQLKEWIGRLVKKANDDKASATALTLIKNIMNQETDNDYATKQTRKLMQLIIADPELSYALSQQ